MRGRKLRQASSRIRISSLSSRPHPRILALAGLIALYTILDALAIAHLAKVDRLFQFCFVFALFSFPVPFSLAVRLSYSRNLRPEDLKLSMEP